MALQEGNLHWPVHSYADAEETGRRPELGHNQTQPTGLPYCWGLA